LLAAQNIYLVLNDLMFISTRPVELHPLHL
jgi:hypothetical protein